MDTNQTDTGLPQAGAQPLAEVPAANSGAQPAFDAQNPIATTDSATLMQWLENDVNPTEQPAATPAAPASEQPPAQTEEPQPADTGAAKPKGRLSVRALPEDQQSQLAAAIDLVRKGESPDIASAILSLSGATAAVVAPSADSDAPPAPLATPPPAATQAPEVAEIQERLSSLREQRRAAKLDYNGDEELRLTEEIENAGLELLEAKQSASLRQVAVQSYQREFSAAVDTVEAKYPESMDETTAFSRILDDKVDAARARNDPALQDPNYIVAFADEVAEMLGHRAVTPAMPRPPARASRPVGSSLAPGQGLGKSMSLQDARNLVKTASIDDLKAAMFVE